MKKSIFLFAFAIAILLPLTTAVVAGQDQSKKAQDHSKVEVCHITGSYDFGDGEVPIGHVIKIAEPALYAHLKHGDTANWDVVTLSDGREVCFEPAQVCHITGFYDFDDEVNVPIGDVLRIPAAYYQTHIEHGDPETYRVVTLPYGPEVCREFVENRFENGMALLGHDSKDGHQFTRYLRADIPTLKVYMGQALSETLGAPKWGPMTSFYIDGKQYIMGLRSYGHDDEYPYFIQQILPSGDFGPQTKYGVYKHQFKTLIAMTMANGDVFIFLQEDGNNNFAVTQQILPGGKLGSEVWHDDWDTYYDTVTPLPYNNGRTCFFAHDSDDHNIWRIYCLHQPGMGTEGSVYLQDHGDFDDGFQVALSYLEGGQTFLFRHRKHLEGVHERGPWVFNKITDLNKMGSITDSGTEDNGKEWDKYYQTMTTFFHPDTTYQYLFGHNTEKDWFIQHVSSTGRMDDVNDSGGPWDAYYENVLPVPFDKETYYHVGSWMGRLHTDIPDFGERKLTEIALPGSHDAGMNKDDTHGCSAGGHNCNTVTQTWNIQGQLALGARFFDIRPMLDTSEDGHSQWTTGHGTKFGTDITAGCRGEEKSRIIYGLENFFDDNTHSKELVILKVSHCMTPPGNGYANCTKDQIESVAYELALKLDAYLVKCDDCELHDMTLNEILEHGNIILTVKGTDSHKSQGIFKYGTDYYTQDKFSNTNKFDVMVNGGTNNDGDHDDGQISKLLNYVGDWPFVLSWTLTLNNDNVAWCWDGGISIMELAFITEPRLFEFMYDLVDKGKLTKKYFPNILYVDDFYRTATSAAIYLNKKWDDLPD